ncbi:hypothetical protein [Parasphingorhabdus sp.]|uniref:hypothetical protein n=1 Tax=Parasphingorhabdus sp. TaxID=2709688 RepID=UPI003A94FA9E
MNTEILLPQGFEDLGPLVKNWARPTEDGRNQIRWCASKEDFAIFYSAMMPRLDSVLSELQAYPLDGMDEAQSNLFNLAAAFAEASPHEELYGGSSEVPHSFSARRFVPGHGNLQSAGNIS